MGELYHQLKKYGDSDYYPYHMPGHKRHLSGDLPKGLTDIDITEIEGFDNLHQAEGILQKLQERAARMYGAEESFYLINGSTSGILSAVSAALPEKGHLLLARNCHKSAYHASYLRNLKLSYLYPEVLAGYDICDAVTPMQVEEALKREPDIGAVLIVSPTYEGRIADVKKIAEVVHAKGLPLIVDEAHGAHLGFEEHFAPNSCRCGADIVIHSVHKTLPALTQTALLHVNGNRIDRKLLRRFLHIYQTSSPSYVLMAGIDNALELVDTQGKKLFSSFAAQYEQMLAELSACRHLEFVPMEAGKQDIGKLVISAKKIELSGSQLYDILLEKYHLQLEMTAGDYCLAMFTIGDTKEAYDRMAHALLEIDHRYEGKPHMGRLKVVGKEMQSAVSLREAWDCTMEEVPLQQAVGRHVGEFINLYPPGSPILVPGELFSEEIYSLLQYYLQNHLNVQGIKQKQEMYYVDVLTKQPERN